MKKTFTELGLLPALEQGLACEKIVNPTPIQVEAVPAVLDGKDTYISSETGTGKTLAYLLPLFSRIDPSQKSLQVIVMAPTHELVVQIRDEARLLATNSGLDILTQAIVGGTSTKRQIERLKKKPHMIVGSCGRIRELINSRKLKVHKVKTVVVDEVDRLLAGDRAETVNWIIGRVQRDRQLVFVSATEQTESSREAEALATDLVRAHVGCNQVSTSIDHLYFVCEDRKKADLVRKLIRAIDPPRAIVFVHRNSDAQLISSKLAHHKLVAADIHSAKDKFSRKKALDRFRSGRIQVLISSDIAARGLDIKGVTHIFNLDLPGQAKAYLHRAGRTGRAGAEGMTISLVSEQQVRLIERHAKELGITIARAKLREGQISLVQERK